MAHFNLADSASASASSCSSSTRCVRGGIETTPESLPDDHACTIETGTPEHGHLPQRRALKRYKDIAALFMKYGRSELVEERRLEEALVEAPVATPSEEKLAEQLAADLEKMGPTSSRSASSLHPRRPPAPPVRRSAGSPPGQGGAVSVHGSGGHRQRELGVRLSKAFAEFEPEPVAAASMKAAISPGPPVLEDLLADAGRCT